MTTLLIWISLLFLLLIGIGLIYGLGSFILNIMRCLTRR